MAGPGPQGLEPEAVQQVVHGLEAPGHAELGLQDAADVLAPQGAYPVPLGRPGGEPVPEPPLLVARQRGLAAAAGPVGQCGGAAGVVPGDPGADLPLGQEHLPGDLRGGAAEEGQPHGGQPPCQLRPALSTDEFGELVGGVVRLDVHGGLLPDTANLRTDHPTGSY